MDYMGINIPEVERQKASKALHCDRQCPLWVISGHLRRKKSYPLYPRKRTFRARVQCLLSANSGHCQPYSITSSARPISVLGMLRPSVLAVFRLMTSSTLVAC
jgi:hypothetical protein